MTDALLTRMTMMMKLIKMIKMMIVESYSLCIKIFFTATVFYR